MKSFDSTMITGFWGYFMEDFVKTKDDVMAERNDSPADIEDDGSVNLLPKESDLVKTTFSSRNFGEFSKNIMRFVKRPENYDVDSIEWFESQLSRLEVLFKKAFMMELRVDGLLKRSRKYAVEFEELREKGEWDLMDEPLPGFDDAEAKSESLDDVENLPETRRELKKYMTIIQEVELAKKNVYEQIEDVLYDLRPVLRDFPRTVHRKAIVRTIDEELKNIEAVESILISRDNETDYNLSFEDHKVLDNFLEDLEEDEGTLQIHDPADSLFHIDD